MAVPHRDTSVPSAAKKSTKVLHAYADAAPRLVTRATARIRSKTDLALHYTPGVGAVAAHLARRPKDARNLTVKKNSIAVISDGSAVLGLGNIGPLGALPVMEGKALLFRELAGVDAWPIVLNTQDPDEIIQTIRAIAPGFGGINLEDIAAPQCFAIEAALVEALDIPVMHDDQHGTAIVVLAALINAAAVVQKALKRLRIVILGAGAAGTATAQLLIAAGARDVVLVDRRGIIARDRGDLDARKAALAVATNPRTVSGNLIDALTGADVVIGLSGGGSLTHAHIAAMAPQAVVFALANPTPEILPNAALAAGAAVVATGRSDFPNQVNNALVFPGVFRGLLDYRKKMVTQAMKLKAARALAALVSRPTATRILPEVLDRRVVPTIARAMR